MNRCPNPSSPQPSRTRQPSRQDVGRFRFRTSKSGRDTCDGWPLDGLSESPWGTRGTWGGEGRHVVLRRAGDAPRDPRGGEAKAIIICNAQDDGSNETAMSAIPIRSRTVSMLAVAMMTLQVTIIPTTPHLSQTQTTTTLNSQP